MLRRLIILLLIVGCGSDKSSPINDLPQISDGILSQMREELDSWMNHPDSGGRWEYQGIDYDSEENSVTYTIQCLYEANEIEMKEYCRVVKDIHYKYAREYPKSIAIIHPNSKVDFDCR